MLRAVAAALLLIGCASDGAAPIVDNGPAAACYGSKDAAAALIDPDNPTFADSAITNAEVREKFSRARERNSGAYRAYRAALANADVLSCAFCKCGCAGGIGHVSALDCFKDMHGFG